MTAANFNNNKNGMQFTFKLSDLSENYSNIILDRCGWISGGRLAEYELTLGKHSPVELMLFDIVMKYNENGHLVIDNERPDVQNPGWEVFTVPILGNALAAFWNFGVGPVTVQRLFGLIATLYGAQALGLMSFVNRVPMVGGPLSRGIEATERVVVPE